MGFVSFFPIGGPYTAVNLCIQISTTWNAYVEFHQPFPLLQLQRRMYTYVRCMATHYYSNMALMSEEISFAVRLRNMRSFAVAGHYRKEMYTHEPFSVASYRSKI